MSSLALHPPLAVRPVRTRGERRLFLTFPWRIYHDDPLWVPPLLPDWAERIDPAKGVFFKRGEAEFFIAWRDGQPVGTICAAEDREENEVRHARECVFGFFNFIEDYAVMEALLGRAREWATGRGLDALTGPFNLDYEDSYGILVEGRDRPPTLMCGHTPPYYLGFVERYGFQPVRGDNIAFALDLTQDNPALRELEGMAERVRQRRSYTVRPADLLHWEDELERIYVLLNTAMTHLPDYRTWPREVVYSSLAPFRKIVDPELVLFAQDGERVVGWLPGLPNLNEAFIHVNGLRQPWDYLKLAWYMRRSQRPHCLAVKSVLVPPEYWGSGVVILLFDQMVRTARARGYRWIDASLTSDDNPRTPALGARFGAKIYKRIRVYRLQI
jgi:GNAT superfamily N-acetyltransferase